MGSISQKKRRNYSLIQHILFKKKWIYNYCLYLFYFKNFFLVTKISWIEKGGRDKMA